MSEGVRDPTGVWWLLVPAEDVPAGDEWLSPEERETLDGLRFSGRRRDWRLGRWAAKRAVSLHLAPEGAPSATPRIEAAADGAPEAWVGGTRAPVAVSLSHRDGLALCAVAGPDVLLGCDLEVVEARHDAFVADYLTPAERAAVEASSSPDELVTVLWSGKESALKAMRSGLRTDTRSVAVRAEPTGEDAWGQLAVETSGPELGGWWRRLEDHVATIVASPAPDIPVGLAGSIEAREP